VNIVFQSDEYVVVDKPACTLSVPSRMGKEDTRSCLGIELQNLLKIKIYPVHRLDFEVSGLLLFALNAQAHKNANLWFEQDLVSKKYQAFSSDGPFDVGFETLWTSQILRGKKRSFESPHGKWAKTKAFVKSKWKYKNTTVIEWELWPLTGKAHQLRYEMYKNKVPVWGDTLYGSHLDFPIPGIALKAIELDLAQCPNRGSLPAKLVSSPLLLVDFLKSS